MSNIDTVVQAVLNDERLSPQQRAEEAALQIDRHVRDLYDLPVNLPLPVPAQWQHRVPSPSFKLAPVEPVLVEAQEAAPRRRWWNRKEAK